MIVGVATDPVFGPILMLGLGGIYVEALGDVAFRIQPVSRGDAREMLASLRGGRLLDGVRGEPAVDKNTLVEVVERVSQLVGDHHRIMELDINPFLALPDGGVALDARIRVSDRPTTTSPWRTFSHAQAVTTPGTSRA
jgi:acetyltransferase